MNPQLGTTSGSEEASRLGTDEPVRGELRLASARVVELEARLREQARERAELVHLVSHELRTQITVMTGFVRLLQNEVAGTLNQEQMRFVAESLRACERLDSFVGDLLGARDDSSAVLQLETSRTDLRETIHGQVNAMKPLLSENGVKLEIDLGIFEAEVACDARRIEQVMANLLTNAIRHGGASSKVRIEMRSRGDLLEVSVEDEGPGIPEPDRERLFAPFVRGGQVGCGSGEPPGLGIGLSISRRIIEAHEGRIWVEKGELGGARFVFLLPRSISALRED